MSKGTVKFFNDSKGFGFIIEDDNNKEHFVHISGLIDEIREGASNSSLILSNWFNTVILRRKRKLQPDSTAGSGEEPDAQQ